MPFDGVDRPARRRTPKSSAKDDRAITFIIVLLAVVLLVMPISIAALGDIVRFLSKG